MERNIETILPPKTTTSFREKPNNETLKAIQEAQNAKQLDAFHREELEKMISAL